MISFDKTMIYLARHGQSVLNLEKRLSGQLNTHLSDKGQIQARALGDVLRQVSLTAIYSSSLDRAIQTACPTAKIHGLDIQALDELQEIRLGVLEGRYTDDRDPEAQRLWAERQQNKNSFVITGGERYRDFKARVISGLEQILASHRGSILIVGHRNTNEVILAKLINPAEEINIKNKYVYAISCEQGPKITTIRLGGENHGRHYQGLKS